ncbi:MAG: hypothetical protein M3N98_11540, partial [Actinomycetota bacterium]|nr:hypothetical protein [Actinomycetota bacterium]
IQDLLKVFLWGFGLDLSVDKLLEVARPFAGTIGAPPAPPTTGSDPPTPAPPPVQPAPAPAHAPAH